MQKSEAPGINDVSFASREEAEAYISEIAESVSNVSFQGDARDFYINYAGGSLGLGHLHRGTHSGLKYNVSPSQEFHFVVLQKNGTTFTGAGESITAAAQRSLLLLPPHVQGRCDVQPDTSGISYFAPADAVRAHVTRILGDTPGSLVDEPAALGLADAVVGSFARNVVSVFHEMQTLGRSGLSDVAAANFDELLLGLAATLASPDVGRTIGGRAHRAGTMVVRRACEFIQAHAADPLRLSELAQRLGVGLRALQLGFRREMGCSPRQYLTRCRLELARTQLLARGAEMTVTQVAFACGFTDLAVFSRKYREAYGELPSETLRRR
jgi:AraC-like DNA-binding protein